jgi:hypothetical protein
LRTPKNEILCTFYIRGHQQLCTCQHSIALTNSFQRTVAISGRQRRRDDEQHPPLRLQLPQRALLQRVLRGQRSHPDPAQRRPGQAGRGLGLPRLQVAEERKLGGEAVTWAGEIGKRTF